ncbi:uncharacterized protein PAC_13049 [Phialocephala subalpina]|uniref:Uncharacterized protein n=1 Tax=Phialocephala subalpina TaxID=576137 RepID=A0A1L7XDQ9_9HELO|nr:uncharacterized protein PAC_13049 [Phialocephala subalpina]
MINHDEFRVILDDQGRSSIPSCVNDTCIKRPHFDESILPDIIKRLKTTADGFFGRNITHAVISVPAYFADAERQSTKDAAALVGLQALRIVNEPTAAGIAYDLDKPDHESNFIVYNLNSQTCDVTLENIDYGVFEILANASGNIGSDYFEQAVLEHIIGTENMKSQVAKAEEVLSRKTSAKIRHSIAKTELNEVYQSIFEKTLPLIKYVLEEAKVEVGKVEGVILTGVRLYQGVSSDEAILKGVAILAQVLSGIDDDWGCPPVMGLNPLSLGIDAGCVFTKVLPRNTVIPTRKQITVTTVMDNQPSIRIQIVEGDRLLSSKNNEIGAFDILVPPAPAGVPYVDIVFEVDAIELLTVKAEDKAERKEVKVIIGDILHERKWEEEVDAINNEIGAFDILVPPAPAGVPYVDIVFEVDAIELLTVKAEDKAERKEVKVIIGDILHERKWEEEVDAIVMEAEANYEADRIPPLLI